MTAVDAPVLALADAHDLARAGGKAVNLAELIRAGFAVPDGFVVPTPAYAAAAAAAGLDDVLAGAGTGLPARARAALLATAVPAGVDAAVRAAYAAMGPDVAVAVRSSATAEDLPGASFAGQQDTYLNVVGPESVVDAVRRCWASLWTDRAVAYRATEIGTVAGRHAELAVVVQRMVDARAAGVLFTADPVSGKRSRSVVDAAPGLGDAVVSGAVDPDHWAVDDAIEGPSDGCLSEAQLRELVALGRRVEAHFGAPQDIEFAFDGVGALWLTQSRPITTLYPVPPSRAPGLRVHLNGSLAQGLTRPVTPMGLSAFRVVTATVARDVFGAAVPDLLTGPPAFGVAGGRAFADATPVIRSRVGRALLPRVLDVMEARSAVVFRGLLAEPELSVTSTSVLPFVRQIARVALHFRIPPLLLLALARPAAARRHVDRIGAEVRATPAPQELDAVIALLERVMPIMPRTVPVAGAGFLALAVARRAAGPDLDATAVHAVLRSLPHNVTTDMDLELWQRATRLDDAGAAALRDLTPVELTARHRAGTLPPVLARELTGFLAEHGHRAPGEIDLGMPRWRDDPTQVLGSLANYRRITDPSEHPDVRFARGVGAAEAAVAGVVDRVRSRSRVRAVVTRFALRRTRELAGMRETHKDFLVRLLALARTGLAVLGADLAARGLLDTADDVFFLDLREIRSGADLRGTVAARRAEYSRELRRRHIPRVLLSDGTEPEALAAPPPDGALVGTAASAGVVTGPVRVVLDPGDDSAAHLEPGDILVVPSTDPGWTPLFLTAGGLVMEMGGANSHGAVVAREYGIPAVVGVPDATTRLHSGDIVTVDGAAGAVSPAGSPA